MRDLITIVEQFFNGYKSAYNETVEIYKNPSRKEFDLLLRQNLHSVRGLISEDGLYIWDAFYATHSEIGQKFKIGGIHLQWETRRVPLNSVEPGSILMISWNNSWNNPDEPHEKDFNAVKNWIMTQPVMAPLIKGFVVVRA